MKQFQCLFPLRLCFLFLKCFPASNLRKEHMLRYHVSKKQVLQIFSHNDFILNHDSLLTWFTTIPLD